MSEETGIRSEETGIRVQTRSVQPRTEQSEGIGLLPSIKQESGIWQRFWARCRNHKLVLFLLAIIVMQHVLFTWLLMFRAREAERMHSEAMFELMSATTLQMELENRQLQQKIDKLEQEAKRGK